MSPLPEWLHHFPVSELTFNEQVNLFLHGAVLCQEDMSCFALCSPKVTTCLKTGVSFCPLLPALRVSTDKPLLPDIAPETSTLN